MLTFQDEPDPSRGTSHKDSAVASVGPSARDVLIRVLAACIPVNAIDRVLNRVRIEKLRSQFGFCGHRVRISNGLLVECPERLTVGDDVSFGPGVSIMGGGGVVIGNGSMLATRAIILTTEHDPRAQSMQTTAIHAKVEIGESCWIGAGATLLPGVHIGAEAVVGAGAVVTTNIPAFALAVGVPARVVRDRRSPRSAEEIACHAS